MPPEAEYQMFGLTLTLTSIACPEQYDVTDRKGRPAGYVRLRGGRLTVEYPDCCYDKPPVWVRYYDDDSLGSWETDEERKAMLTMIAALLAGLHGDRKRKPKENTVVEDVNPG